MLGLSRRRRGGRDELSVTNTTTERCLSVTLDATELTMLLDANDVLSVKDRTAGPRRGSRSDGPHDRKESSGRPRPDEAAKKAEADDESGLGRTAGDDEYGRPPPGASGEDF
jgi:hypothetical protein